MVQEGALTALASVADSSQVLVKTSFVKLFAICAVDQTYYDTDNAGTFPEVL